MSASVFRGKHLQNIFLLLFLIILMFSAGNHQGLQAFNNSAPHLILPAGGEKNQAGITPITPDGLAKKIIIGPNASGHFGQAISGAEDVNNDGYADVIIGEFNFSTGKGRAYVYFGPVSTSSTTVILTGENTGDNFGYAVSNAGDVNGDGFPDILVGAKGYDNGRGKAYIYYGGESMDNIPDVIFLGENAGDSLGCSVTGGIDFNKDGYDDIAVGANSFNGGTGKVYIFFGGRNMDNTAEVSLNGAASGDYFGGAIDGVPDFNGDGFDDIIAGAKGYNGNTGRAYIYYGGSPMNNNADVTLTGENNGDLFGTSVSSAGDINGDGYADVITGAPGSSGNKGKAYIFMNCRQMNIV